MRQAKSIEHPSPDLIDGCVAGDGFDEQARRDVTGGVVVALSAQLGHWSVSRSELQDLLGRYRYIQP